MATRAPVLIIDGEKVSTREQLEILNPADRSVAGLAPKAGAAELDRAVAAATAAQRSWAHIAWSDRAAYLVKIAEVLETNADELARLETSEQGKPVASALREIMAAAAICRGGAAMELAPEIIEDSERHKVIVYREPLGVVAAIIPWNFPVLIGFMKIALALLAGNSVIVKPSPFTPLTMLRIMELLEDTLPKGVLCALSGDDNLGPLITSHVGIAKISFTGSTATGKRVMESASRNLARVTLELGGNDASIIMPDVDVEAIAETLFWTAFHNSGQVCIAAKRMYVHDAIYDRVAAALVAIARRVKVGNGADEGVMLGPIQNAAQFERVKQLIEDSHAEGHSFLVGGNVADSEGYFIPICIVDNPPEESRVVQEEAFGPVLPLLRFDNVDEVIERANATPFGLGATVWCADEAQAANIAARLDTGSVWINELQNTSPLVPFSGRGLSGLGVEGGIDGLSEFTSIKTVLIGKAAQPAAAATAKS